MKGMTSTNLVALLLASASANAEEYSYIANPFGQPIGPLPTPGEVCTILHGQIVARYTSRDWAVAPYRKPYPVPDKRPGADPTQTSMFACPFQLINLTTPEQPSPSNYPIFRNGDGCKNGEPFNPAVGKCERPDEDQERKEDGVAAKHSVLGAVICGNPINIGAGNKYQEETDFIDPDGEMRFSRHYNSSTGEWRHSFQASIMVRKEALVLTFDDGYSALFSRKDGQLIPDADDAGSLKQEGDDWVYGTAANEIYTFDVNGSLKRIRQETGLSQTLERSTSPTGDVVTTVTDSRGHTLVVTESASGRLTSLVTSASRLRYGYDTEGRLNSVATLWAGRETSRRYVYEDAAHPSKVTGLIDERGVRYATWSYDAEGRATSSEHAGGAEKIALSYAADGSVILTNALGHVTTFRYEVVQGMKRVVQVDGEPALGCPASNSSYTYTASGQLKTHTNALGQVTAYEYDDRGRQIRRVEASGTPEARTTSTTWDVISRRPSVITTPHRMTSYEYDGEGRQVKVTVQDNKE